MKSKTFFVVAIAMILTGGGCANLQKDTAYERKTECYRLGKEYHEKHEKELGDSSALNPRYHYNEAMQTCIYAGGSISGGDKPVFMKFVVDLYTNKTLAETVSVGGQLMPNMMSADQYQQKEKELLEE